MRQLRAAAAAVGAVMLVTACMGGAQAPGDALARDLEQRQAALEAAAAAPDVEGCDGLVPASEPAAPGDAGAAGAAGDRLPGLVLPCFVDGPAVDLARLTGQPTIVNLWATWCEPCREEMPLLAALHDDPSAGVRVLGVDTKDSRASAAGFLASIGVTYPQVVDEDGALLGGLNVVGLPVTLALDEDGRIVDRQIGQLDADALERMAAAAGAQP